MRLIDADALIGKAKEYGSYYEETVYAVPLADIDDAPTIDAVEVVRCKDCMWNDGKGHCQLRYGSLGVFEDVSCDDYCSCGVKGADDE